MRKLPPLIIVTDRGHLVAYRSSGENGSLQRITTAEFAEGNQKLSEIVTDQAGAFPVSGGSGTAAGERMPLVEELQTRCIRKIAGEIRTILQQEKAKTWALAAPSMMNGAILEELGKPLAERLVMNLKRDLVNVPPTKVAAHFHAA